MHKILIYLHIIHLLKSSTCFEHCLTHLQEVYVVIIQGPAEIPDDFAPQTVSGTVGVANLSLSALLARLKAFQLPWSAGL
jgi:hypothetical protein